MQHFQTIERENVKRKSQNPDFWSAISLKAVNFTLFYTIQA